MQSADAPDYRNLSLWHENHPGPLEPRPALVGDGAVDVAIVGAGFTGLWTAYYLKQLEPGLRVAVVEAEIAGFGASGRNGGWCTASLAGLGEWLADPARRDGGIRLQRALFDAVNEVGRVCAAEAIDCHYARGGRIAFASAEPHRAELRQELEQLHALGFGPDDFRWLEPDACAARVSASRNLGGIFSPHCAAIHPLRLVRGLAERVEARGVPIYERSPVHAIAVGELAAGAGRLRAPVVVRATEGYTARLRGEARTLVPIHSMMIATEPLPDAVWKEIGLAQRETFQDARRIVIYGQRTHDGRIAFGARGRYFYGSRVKDRFAPDDAAFREARDVLVSLFPVLADVRITHRWGGALAVARDWRPSVGIDRARGLAWAGGYAGEGVAASNLAGRTLAELLLDRATERRELPWVGRPFPAWEPEPLRWLTAGAVRRAGDALDEADLAGRRPSRLARAIFESMVRK